MEKRYYYRTFTFSSLRKAIVDAVKGEIGACGYFTDSFMYSQREANELVVAFKIGLANVHHPLSLLKEYVYASVIGEFNEFDNG